MIIVQKFFDSFTKLIKKHEQIIIMTHSIPDLDGMGSAIVLNEILNKMCSLVTLSTVTHC